MIRVGQAKAKPVLPTTWPIDSMHSISPALLAALLVLGASLPAIPAAAQERDDTRRMLDQGVERHALQRERELLKDELDDDAPRPTLDIDGKSHTVEHTASDVGRALYLSLQRKQWDAAQRFLDEYLTLADRDPLLVHYAQGALARRDGRYADAERHYRALLALKPDFLPGRLELARVLFEDQQDREAGELFDAIAAAVDTDDSRTAGVRKSMDNFQRALAGRRAWSGAFAFGPTWNDNLNRSSASRTCLLADSSGFCYIDRQLPDAIAAGGVDYDASLDKRLPLRGHHGLYLRTLLFGYGYRDNSAYNELTSTTQAGYSYRSGRHGISLAPTFEYYAWGNDALYAAWGVHGEWSWTLSPNALLKLEADYKDMRYRRQDYARNYDGGVRSAYATYFRSLGPRWTVFGGIDVVASDAQQTANGYLQRGARLGASLQWPAGFVGSAFASYRHRDYSAYSAVLGARRRDDEQNYTFVLKAPRLAFAGFTPLLTLRHNRVHSNVDWLYGYDKNAISLKLERVF
ncbi:surface lipoprotein assembly modifier [Xanthomonas hyacinthi]